MRYPVQQLCQALGVARSSYYYRPVANDDLSVLTWIEAVLAEFPLLALNYRTIFAVSALLSQGRGAKGSETECRALGIY